MTASLLQGEKVASEFKEGLKKDIEDLEAKGTPPHLVAVQVGENAASRIYIKQQHRSCEEMGIKYELKELPGATTEDELLNFIDGLNGFGSCLFIFFCLLRHFISCGYLLIYDNILVN